MKKSSYVIANWKMNPVKRAEARKIFDAVKQSASRLKKTRIVIMPSFVHLGDITASYRGKKIAFGVQDMFWENEGAFTGEVSPTQVHDMGVEYVLVGHSERRALGETNIFVSKKAKAAMDANLCAVLCVGEASRDDEGSYLSELAHQIRGSLDGITKRYLSSLIIAYEPVWAIGGSAENAVTAHDLHQSVLYIRKVLAEKYGKKAAVAVPILYGGSVKESNAEELFKGGEIDGFLVGSASLVPDTFTAIFQTVERLSS